MNQPVEVYLATHCFRSENGGWAWLSGRTSNHGVLEKGSTPRLLLTAALDVLEYYSSIPDTCVTLYTDSSYLSDGLRTWIVKWTRNAWMGQNGPVKHADLWQKIAALKADLGFRGTPLSIRFIGNLRPKPTPMLDVQILARMASRLDPQDPPLEPISLPEIETA